MRKRKRLGREEGKCVFWYYGCLGQNKRVSSGYKPFKVFSTVCRKMEVKLFVLFVIITGDRERLGE